MPDTTLTFNGYCPICEAGRDFVATIPEGLDENWYPNRFRDHLRCSGCKSLSRERGIAHVLQALEPDWRKKRIHESSPGGWAFSPKLRRECADYVPTQYAPDRPFGQPGPDKTWQNEDLENQTFPDASFDIVVTQDVFEHLFDPHRAAREIARTLREGGLYIMTVPVVRKFGVSQRRAARSKNGIRHLLPEQYHGNPVGDGRSLVTIDWAYDIGASLTAASGLPFVVLLLDDMRMGIRDPHNAILYARKGVLPDLDEARA